MSNTENPLPELTRAERLLRQDAFRTRLQADRAAKAAAGKEAEPWKTPWSHVHRSEDEATGLASLIFCDTEDCGID